MDIYQLSAGKPKKSEIPINLHNITFNKSIIKWQVEALKSAFEKFSLTVLVGFRSELYKLKIKNVKYYRISKWENTSILDTFLSIPFNQKSFICHYSDTIFSKDVFKKIKSYKEDLIFTVDTNWEKRFSNRPIHDKKIAEKINIHYTKTSSHNVEFCGLIFFKHNVVNYIKKNKNKIKGETLIDLIKHLKENGFSTNYYDVKNNWTELNYPNDLTQFILSTKSQTLKNLRFFLKKSYIGNQISFTVSDWENNKDKIINNIKKKFKQNIIVRSSSLSEDQFTGSKAGEFLSLPNINPNIENLEQKINKVINSYNQKNIKNNEVFIQKHISNVKISGVIFTCGLTNCSPYFYINYDNQSKDTDAVTSGKTNNLKNFIILRSKIYKLKKINKLIFNLLNSVREIEKALNYQKLDIEFAVDNNGKIHIFQVRPISTKDTYILNKVTRVFSVIDYNLGKFKNLQNKNKNNKNFYSDMSDWNPAEMIGVKPKPLAYSLYSYLITDRIWSKQRFEAGFQDLRNSNLLTIFCGKPYVDINLCFKSFIPVNLNDKIKSKLLKAYISIFEKHPYLHDKIEFDIVFTCWTPNFIENAKKRLMPFGLKLNEILIIEQELKSITNKAINKLGFYIDQSKILEEKRNKALSSKNSLKRINSLIYDCKKYGTSSFSHVARSGFIAVNFINYFQEFKILSNKRIEELYKSLNTITNKFNQDLFKLKSDEISIKEIISKYGHLRPGTYEIETKAYWENLNYFNFSKENFKLESKNILFKFSPQEDKRITGKFKILNINLKSSDLLDFIFRSIQSREEVKFEFTKNISLTLDEIVKFGKKHKIKRNDLSYMKINDFKKLLSKEDILKLIQTRKNKYFNNSYIEMPQIILTESNLYFFEHFSSKPNFITDISVQGEIVEITNKTINNNLKNKIVLIKNADPGYDWIFNHEIAGLVTMYGGANSHMAIRSSEISLVSAIGIGHKKFNELLKYKYIEIDSLNKRIIEIL